MSAASPSGTEAAVRAATLCAAGMIAHQVAAKATRDALFLSEFEVSALPIMFAVAAACSLALGRVSAGAMVRLGPGRLVPIAFLASAVLLLGEAALYRVSRPATAVALYLHVAVLGALVISGFWSMINERFDPRTAKRCASRIAAGATLGGIAGGLVAERVAAHTGLGVMLPLLAAAHVGCAWASRGLIAPNAVLPARPPAPHLAAAILARDAYLRHLGMFVTVAAVATALVDYVFKARAVEFFGNGPGLMRFFAVFHASLGVVTLLVQFGAGRLSLEKLGLARTLALLPGSVGVGAVLALVVPGLGTATLLRALENVVRHGLYRTSYEILFTPVPAKQKRSTKSFIDVTLERLADMLGGGITKLVLLVAPATAYSLLLALALALVAVAVALTVSIHRGYVAALRASLENRAIDLDLDEVQDATTRSTVMMTFGAIDVRELRRRLAEQPGEGAELRQPDEMTSALRSKDPARFRALLGDPSRWDGGRIEELVSLLDRDDWVVDVAAALVAAGAAATEPLRRALLDSDRHVAIRRRSARILGSLPAVPAAAALLAGLADDRFEVRVQSARALVGIRKSHPEIPLDGQLVLEAVLRELHLDRGVWERQQLLDAREYDDSPFVDDLLRERVSRSLDHVFTLLALLLDRESLRIAFRGLHTQDEFLRGTALEYLESVLPTEVRAALWPRLEDTRSARPAPRPREHVLADLYRSHPSIELKIREAGEAASAKPPRSPR